MIHCQIPTNAQVKFSYLTFWDECSWVYPVIPTLFRLSRALFGEGRIGDVDHREEGSVPQGKGGLFQAS